MRRLLSSLSSVISLERSVVVVILKRPSRLMPYLARGGPSWDRIVYRPGWFDDDGMLPGIAPKV